MNMESPQEGSKRIVGMPSPASVEPHVGIHHVLGEEIDASTNEEKMEIQKEILAYEEELLTAMELSPTLTLKAKKILAKNQREIIRKAKAELEQSN